MPITTYPLPVNPTTGQAPFSYTSPRFGPPPPTAAGSGVVSKETLKALQDVVWDDDEDDPDCILCAEPLDLADQNFKPCQCGMQICQFCYNKLLSTDPRCPGCRRPYDVKSVEFHPVDWEEVKRAKEKKARKAKTIKQLDGLGRRHLLDVRIIMRNTVFVTGMKLPAPGDEAIPILRTNEYFGQYGKIQRLHLKERPSSDEPGIFIVFVRREDAARAIAALDGVAAPGGPPGTVLKATYGTTHYCDSFLRGQKCDTIGCTGLHEWGGENDTFTKDDMETAILRPAQYDARQKQAQHQLPNLSIKSQWPKPSAEEVVGSAGLPSSASWGKHIGAGRAQQPGRNGVVAPGPGAVARPGKPPAVVSLTKNPAAFPLPTPSPLPITIVKEKRKANAANAQANAVGAATGTAMARGRSTDSAQSGSGTTSSAQTSPKKRGTNLPSAVATPSKVVTGSGQAAPPAPPPGLATTSATPSKAAAKKVAASAPPSNVPEPDDVPETTSNESEAGPSSSSPAPQTPSAINGDALYPPPPLTADPIFLHTPYEEPDLELFPMSDPDFRYSLDLDEEEIRRYASEAGGYTPSPFDKMLVGLAELGVLARDVDVLDEIAGAHPGKRISWHGNFQPFDANPLEALKANDTGSGMTDSDHAQMYGQQSYGAGPSSRRTSVDHDGPRTASRFDFARPPSAGASSIMSARTSMTNMHSSPFAILQRRTQMAEEMGAMSPQYQLHLQQQQQQQLQHQEQQRQQQHQQQLQQVLQQQLRNTGTFSAPPGFGNMGPQEQHSNQGDMGSWAAESSNMASASNARQSPSYGKMTSRDGRQYGMGGKRAPDMDEYDPALAYPPASSRSTFRTLFSPEHDNPNLPRHASPSNAYHSHAAQSSQPQSTPGPAGQTRTPVYAMDARTLQQYHAMRAVSPTPASTGLGGGYARRY